MVDSIGSEMFFIRYQDEVDASHRFVYNENSDLFEAYSFLSVRFELNASLFTSAFEKVKIYLNTHRCVAGFMSFSFLTLSNRC